MRVFDLRRHTIGAGGIIIMPEHGGEWYVVPSDNDGTQQRAIEEMAREARREETADVHP